MQKQGSLSNSFGRWARGATLAVATLGAVAGFGGAAFADDATAQPTTKATLDEKSCLPMSDVATLDGIISDAKAREAEFTAQRDALTEKNKPGLEQMAELANKLSAADDKDKPELTRQIKELQDSLKPDRDLFIEASGKLNEQQGRELLATFQKGIITSSVWPDIVARGKALGTVLDGTCLSPMGDTPAAVTRKDGLTTLDITTGSMQQMGPMAIYIASSPEELLPEVDGIVTQSIYYASQDSFSPPDNVSVKEDYDLKSVLLLMTTGNAVAAADQIIYTVEKAIATGDTTQLETSYDEFPEYADTISEFYLQAADSIENDKIPEDLRAQFRRDTVTFALQSEGIRNTLVTAAANQVMANFSHAFRPGPDGQPVLVNPGPLLYLADTLYSHQLDEAEQQKALERFGPDIAALPIIDTYNQWDSNENDPATPAMEAIEKMREQAKIIVAKVRASIEQHKQEAAPTAPAAPAP